MGDYLETKIREFRQNKGLIQQELADAAGVTRQTINALENARYNPSLLLAYKITKILDKDSIEERQGRVPAQISSLGVFRGYSRDSRLACRR